VIRASTFSDKWPIVKLGDVVNFLDHKRVPITKSDRTPGEYQYYGANGSQGTINDFIFDEPLVLLAEDGGNFGHETRTIAYIARGKYWVNNHAHVLQPKDCIDLDYLCRVLERYDVTPFVKGATRAKLSKTDASRIPIPLPPLETQKQIAAVLEKADQLRKDCQKMEQELNSLAQSVFIEMFGDPVTNPKGWTIKPLVELLNKPLQNGAYYPKEDYCEDGVEMVHMSDVFYDFVERGNMKRVKVSKKDIAKYKLTSNDILISRRSLMLEGAAKPSLVQESGEDLIFESSIIRLTPDTKQVNIMYLFYYLSNPKAKQHYVYQYITGATIKGINQTNLEKVEILVPDMEVQNSFLERESIIRNQKNDLKKLKIETDTNFNSLMQKAFNGELNLDNANT
tara:strand:+ start:243 stop:1430 length:1188 start_codon:yes stop_codon:yes gene_type:complete